MYKPGDKVWVHVPKGHIQLPNRDLAAVVSVACSVPQAWLGDDRYNKQQWYHILIEGHSSISGHWYCPHCYLSPRHDPYEGDRAGSWDTAPWQPEKVTI